jgi:hypothetical protein
MSAYRWPRRASTRRSAPPGCTAARSLSTPSSGGPARTANRAPGHDPLQAVPAGLWGRELGQGQGFRDTTDVAAPTRSPISMPARRRTSATVKAIAPAVVGLRESEPEKPAGHDPRRTPLMHSVLRLPDGRVSRHERPHQAGGSRRCGRGPRPTRVTVRRGVRRTTPRPRTAVPASASRRGAKG